MKQKMIPRGRAGEKLHLGSPPINPIISQSARPQGAVRDIGTVRWVFAELVVLSDI